MKTITAHGADVMSSYVSNSTSTLSELASLTLTVESGKTYVVFYSGELYAAANATWYRLALMEGATELSEVSKRIQFENSVYENHPGVYRGTLGSGSITLTLEYSNYDNSTEIRARRGRIIVIEEIAAP